MCSWTAMVNNSWMKGLAFMVHEDFTQHNTSSQCQEHKDALTSRKYKNICTTVQPTETPSASWAASTASSACSEYNM